MTLGAFSLVIPPQQKGPVGLHYGECKGNLSSFAISTGTESNIDRGHLSYPPVHVATLHTEGFDCIPLLVEGTLVTRCGV